MATGFPSPMQPRPSGNAAPSLPRGYRAKDWSWDPDTGEWSRVTFRSRHGNLVELSSRNDRGTHHLKAVRKSRNMLTALIVTAIAVVVLQYWSSSSTSLAAGGAGIALLLAWPSLVILAVGWPMTLIESKRLESKIGPPPVQIDHGQEVDDQRVHDTGGFMGSDELRAALRGQGSRDFKVEPRPWEQ